MEPFDRKGDFEQGFSLAFEGAEIAPESHLWDRIDAVLAKSQNSSFRKRLLFFQLVAAASLVFAAGITLFQVLSTDNDNPSLNSSQQIESSEIKPDYKSEDPIENNTLAESRGIDNKADANESNNTAQLNDQMDVIKEPAVPIKIEDTDTQKSKESIAIVENNKDQNHIAALTSMNSEYSSNKVEMFIKPSGYQIISELKSYEPLFIPIWTKKPEEDKSALWASAGFAAGSYNPSSGVLNLGFAAADETAVMSPADQQDGAGLFSEQQNGRSIGGGVGFGGKLSRKWLLESGLNYIHSEIDGTTNGFIESNGNNYPVFYDSKFAGAIQSTNNYGVTNSLDFISVPIKAGYVIIDKKIGWVATGGLGSNFLIGNSLSSDLTQLDRVNYSIGDSPYRRLSWSGIIGTEVYFNITKDYQLLVVPQYNFGISEITREESSFSIIPNSFNLGIRFRYLLK
jgi:hypothetical protein